MASMMQKAQQMQQDMQKAQEEIKKLTATGDAGAGAINITIDGNHRATKVSINDTVMDDKEMLEDLLLTAINDAVEQISKASTDKMNSVAGGLNLPPGMNLPF